MPEMVEVEMYRRSLAPALGGVISDVHTPDPLWVSRSPDAARILEGCVVTAARRVGKVLLVDTDGPVLGLRFGMTGRLVVGGASAVDTLAYGAHGDDPAWVRLEMRVGDTLVAVSDPRRLGRLELDPRLDDLGPDAAEIDVERLGTALAGSRSVKTLLLDQHRIAGLGNMLADDALLRAGIHPLRPASTLTADEVGRLASGIRVGVAEALRAGGSHQGLLSARHRRAGAPCPLDGHPLDRIVVGARTTYVCCAHQR